MKNAVQVYAVVRVDEGMQEMETAVTVKEIVSTMEEAVAEVERLNKLNAAKGCRYFWQTTRCLSQGLKAKGKTEADG